MSKTFKLVAWLALCLPMSSAFAQWSYKPVLTENVASGGSRWVLDVSVEVTAGAGDVVWMNAVEMAIAFSSAALTSDELEAFVGGATLSAFTSSDEALGIRRAFTLDSTDIALVWAQASGTPGLTCTVSGTTCTIPLVTITVPAGPAVEDDVVTATVANLDSGTAVAPGIVEADPLAYVASGSTVVVPEEPTVVAVDSALEYTFPAAPGLDLNGDGKVNGNDAVILYFASPESGVSTSLGREAIRRNVLRAYSGLPDPASATNAALDPVLEGAVTAANALLAGNPSAVDINGDNEVNGNDAVILYFASPESGVSTSLGREAIRRNVLRAYSGLPDPASATNAALDPVLESAVTAANGLLVL